MDHVRPTENGQARASRALAAVARDTIDVASEIIRDGILLGRLEAQRAMSEMVPRLVWGIITFLCATAAIVLGMIALMFVLGAIIPSAAGRLALLAGVLCIVAFFSAIRVMRPSPERSVEPIGMRERPMHEGTHLEETPGATLPGTPGRSR